MEKEKEKEKELVYIRDPCRDRVKTLLRLCPVDRICEIEKIERGKVGYPVFIKNKFFLRAA